MSGGAAERKKPWNARPRRNETRWNRVERHRAVDARSASARDPGGTTRGSEHGGARTHLEPEDEKADLPRDARCGEAWRKPGLSHEWLEARPENAPWRPASGATRCVALALAPELTRDVAIGATIPEADAASIFTRVVSRQTQPRVRCSAALLARVVAGNTRDSVLYWSISMNEEPLRVCNNAWLEIFIFYQGI